MIFRLHPLLLDRDGLVTALSEQLEQIGQDAGLEVSFASTLTCDPQYATSAIAYRTAQEAMMNAWKHAAARHLDVRVDETADGITLAVTDDGTGFDSTVNRPGHIGLVSMRDRIELAGGWFRIDSAPSHGTTIAFFVPFIADTGHE
jgi:signal transduction histidine kinase